MAEAVGLAASVAGLISLGIQVTQGIASYIDALESRKDELLSLKQRKDAFSSTLDVIEAESKRLLSQHQDAALAVTHSVQSCSHDLEAVKRLLADLAPGHASTLRDRWSNKKKKLTYFVDRSKLQDLNERLDRANSALQLALAGLGLDISRLHTDKLGTIESSSHETSRLVMHVRCEVAEVGETVDKIHDQSNTLCNNISAAGQLMVAHSEASAAQHRKEMKELKRFIQELYTGKARSVSPELDLAKLANKPAALKGLCDEMGLQRRGSLDDAVPSEGSGRQQRASAPRPRIPPSDYAAGYSCICQRRDLTSTVHANRHWGPVSVSRESSTTGHWPRCPLARVANTRRHTVGVRYTGLARLLRAAVGLSFSLTSGAGGFSLRPGFAYCPTVDEWSDPAFRILRLLGWGRAWDLDPGRLFYAACLKRLARLLCEGRACPAAVNDRNQTLMHRATKAARQLSLNTKARAGLEELLQLLLSFNVPAFSYDCSGHSPMASFRPSSYAPPDWGSSDSWILTLSKENSEGRPVALGKGTPSSYGDGTRTLACYHDSPFIAKAYGCGPLSLAVLSNKAEEVEHLVRRFPSMLDEVDDHGYSPLHLAINKPKCLEALVPVASIAQLNQRTYGGSSVLDLAMQTSSGNCAHGRRHQKCRRCSCARCVAILLRAGCAVRKVDRHFGALLATASERARRRYVCHMARTRASRRKRNGAEEDGGGGIYRYLFLDHDEDYELHAELFHRHGFRPGPGYPAGLARASPAYVCWLLDHGVDLNRRVASISPGNAVSASGKSGAHHAYYAVGNWSKIESAAPELDRMNAIALPHRRKDGCRCHCSAGGCTPFVWMLKGAKARRSSPLRSRGFYRLLESFFRLCNPEHTRPCFLAALRYATFEALGLNHTCCTPHRIVGRGAPWAGREDARLINEEQAALLERHERLVAGFEAEAAGVLGPRAAPAGDGAPLAAFWRARWLGRMEAELEQLDGAALTAAERRAAEAIGVRWCAPAPAAAAAAEEEKKPPHYLAGTLAYWFYELDQICPEYKEPWPRELAEEWLAVEQMSAEELEEWNEGREWRRFEEWVLVRN